MFSRSFNLRFETLPWFLLFQSMVMGMLDAIPNTDCDIVTPITYYNHTINSSLIIHNFDISWNLFQNARQGVLFVFLYRKADSL